MDAIQLSKELPFEKLVEAIKQLSPREKLLIHDAIWDEQIPIPSKQQELVCSRMQEAKQNPGSLPDWEEAKQALKGPCKSLV